MATRYKLTPKAVIYDVLRKLRESNVDNDELSEEIIIALEDFGYTITEDEEV